MATMMEALRGQNFMALTTYRKNGQEVATPVWFAETQGHVYVWTELNSGKVKRLRKNKAVLVAPSDVGGKPTGPCFAASARLLDAKEDAVSVERADAAFKKKYGLQLALFRFVGRARGGKHLFIEIDPETTPA